jgi:hypothetical protein
MVEAVAREIGEVDAADERELVVDHDRLLVVAVHRPLAAVERTADARRGTQPLARRPDLSARWVKQRDRRAGPQQDPNVDRLGELSQQPAEDDGWILVADDFEARLEMPARNVDVGPRGAQALRDAGKRLGSVDEHLDPISRPRRRIARGPATGRYLDGAIPAVSVKSTPMVCANHALEAVTEKSIELHAFIVHRSRPW